MWATADCFSCVVEAKLGKTATLGQRKKDPNGDDVSIDSEEDSEEDEDEDEEGELVTEALDSEIFATLDAIRSKDPRVYDKDVKFYSEIPEDDPSEHQVKKDRPMNLRDYHRQNLLSGAAVTEEEDAPQSFAQEQESLKRQVIQELHAAVGEQVSDEEDKDEDGGFLIAKSRPVPEPKAERKKEVQLDVENADKDPETFLSNFMSSKAWVPTKSSQLQAFDSDDDEEDKRAEVFEEAYNFRFEDPNKLNEKLMTHARDTTNQFSVRREEMSGRKKVREAERQKKEEEKRTRETQRKRLRKLKMEELEEKMQKIRQAAGLKADTITEEEWARLLDDNWDDEKWDKQMQRRFGEDYYAAPDGDLDAAEASSRTKRRPKKPTWDDDIDIKDLVPDFEDDETPDINVGDGGDDDESSPETSKAQEKRDKRRAARKERRLIEDAVERNLDLEPSLLPGATRKNSSRFHYRETSPQSFGLTAKDILMADDAQLNEFVGLKKLASFRDSEKKRRDQKKMGKKARLRQWRKDVFGDEDGPQLEFGQGTSHVTGVEKGDQGDELTVDIREGGARKKRKRSKKH